jgi:chromosome segregation ATPase
MPRKGIVQSDVMASIQALLEKGEVPSAVAIRRDLGRGSLSTIQKHFRAWKGQAFESSFKKETKSLADPQGLVHKSLREGRALHGKIAIQLEQNKLLASELIRAEQENLALKAQNHELQVGLKALDQKHQALVSKSEHLEKLCGAIQAERKAMAEAIAQNQQKQIESLQQELREVNQYALDKLRAMGYEGDEALMAEKVRVIHLEDKLKALESELKKQKEANQRLSQVLNRKEGFIEKARLFETDKESQPFIQRGGD